MMQLQNVILKYSKQDISSREGEPSLNTFLKSAGDISPEHSGNSDLLVVKRHSSKLEDLHMEEQLGWRQRVADHKVREDHTGCFL